MDFFERLNRETRDYNNRNVDRFNDSTRGNYNRPNLSQLNRETYYYNNGMYPSNGR